MIRALVFSLLLACTAQAAEFERILLPVWLSTPAPGIGGSLWSTELWFRNSGETSLTMIPPPCSPPIPAHFCSFPAEIDPNRTMHVTQFAADPEYGPAIFLNITKGRARDLRASLRVVDRNNAGNSAGTEVPIVRESDLFTTPVNLLNVTAGGPYRVLLRIYAFDAQLPVPFRVRIFDLKTDALLNELTVSTSLGGRVLPEPGITLTPDFAAVPIDVPGGNPATLRVQVEPLAAERYWAFVSITNNTDTRLITVVTP
jgi:hypothetical protein